MVRRMFVTSLAGIAAAAAAGVASAAMMHPVLGARLSGMGESGVVNLTANTTKSELCWTFDVMAKGLTGASIRDAAGMSVANLGAMYRAKGCAMVSKMVLDEVETKPGAYHVWLATKNHPGDLRGTLFAGMAHATHM